mmetsp:Transcript_26304/g.42632  ORF Transcript_26304/g.42632 Transcript_26304/m.42632 type:complete len:216 (-) Transcript_26304:96-743(-)
MCRKASAAVCETPPGERTAGGPRPCCACRISAMGPTTTALSRLAVGASCRPAFAALGRQDWTSWPSGSSCGRPSGTPNAPGAAAAAFFWASAASASESSREASQATALSLGRASEASTSRSPKMANKGRFEGTLPSPKVPWEPWSSPRRLRTAREAPVATTPKQQQMPKATSFQLTSSSSLETRWSEAEIRRCFLLNFFVCLGFGCSVTKLFSSS